MSDNSKVDTNYIDTSANLNKYKQKMLDRNKYGTQMEEKKDP